MTTIAVDVARGIMAADSRVTHESEASGMIAFTGEKMYRKNDAIIGVAGEGFAALKFVEWLFTGKEPPDLLVLGEADFTAIVLRSGELLEYDKWCIGEKIPENRYAIGSGRKAAMGALEAGASVQRAVEIACKYDPYSGPPVVIMRLNPSVRRRAPKKIVNKSPTETS